MIYCDRKTDLPRPNKEKQAQYIANGASSCAKFEFYTFILTYLDAFEARFI